MTQFNLSITLEYGLIGSDDKETLVEIVNKWIAEGWQPLGGPFVYEGDLCQAIVREKPKVYKHDFELGWRLDTPSP